MIGFELHEGEKFKDVQGNVATFIEYSQVTGHVVFLLEDPGIAFSQPFDDFYQQYMFGMIMEVCNAPT